MWRTHNIRIIFVSYGGFMCVILKPLHAAPGARVMFLGGGASFLSGDAGRSLSFFRLL